MKAMSEAESVRLQANGFTLSVGVVAAENDLSDDHEVTSRTGL